MKKLLFGAVAGMLLVGSTAGAQGEIPEKKAPASISACRTASGIKLTWSPADRPIDSWVIYRTDLGAIGRVVPHDFKDGETPTWFDGFKQPEGKFGYQVYVYYHVRDQDPPSTKLYVDEETPDC